MVLVHDLIGLYIWILVLSALLSWLPSTTSTGALATIKRVLAAVTEPVLRPVRAMLPGARFGNVGVDFSALVVVVVLIIINNVLPG